MDSRHMVDPELAPGLDFLPTMDFASGNLPALRAQLQELYDLQARELPAGEVRQREVFVPGPEGEPDVRVLVYEPASRSGAAPLPAYLQIHGGGYVLGTADMSAGLCAAIVSALHCVVVSVDYRLAPETAFPGNIEDCYAALRWLHAQAGDLGVDPGRIGVGGESAGGGLAASLALLARDRGEVPVAHQQLIYPMLDDREPREVHPYTGEFGWTREHSAFGWRSLLGGEPGGEGVSPYAAAARADDLAGLPPAFISVGSLDLFLEDILEYTRRLTRAGVKVELHVYPGAYHGSDVVAAARLSRNHMRDQMAALAAGLGCTPG